MTLRTRGGRRRSRVTSIWARSRYAGDVAEAVLGERPEEAPFKRSVRIAARWALHELEVAGVATHRYERGPLSPNLRKVYRRARP